MEGCPRLPAISFDPKISIEPVNLCERIPNYISTTYQESGEKYASECEQMNRLRQTAMNVSMDEAGLQTVKRYYCQLLLLRNRFPMLPETECAVRFTWEDAYQKEDVPYNDIRYEEACILYNIGAMYSRLGANEARRTHESIKNACTYFRCAAACFEKVRDQYTTYTSDLTPELLTCQVHILLAQAHEAVLEKSLLDQRAASVTAHVAMQISEYYQMALLNLTKPGVNSIISKKFREWRVALTYKLSYYLTLTYFCSGVAAEEGKKRGEAVCYYENAVERLKEAWKNAEKISSDKTNVFKDAHIFTNDVVMGKYKVAKRDNDSVYFEKVPALSSLPAIQGAIVAKSQPFDCHDPEVCGADIFQKLVPLDAHLAASEYSEEKAKVLREIVELTENKNRELETFMLCLQLNRIPLNNEYLRLPRELLDCCAAVSLRPNMSKDLVAAMQQLNSQHHEVTDQVNEFEETLKTLEEDSESIKINKEYKDLQQNLKSIRDMLTQANESNVELHRHMTTIIDHLKILQSPLEQLEKTLPIITELDDETNKPKIARLALLNEKVETMKKQREMLISDFRKKIQDDDITKLVLMQRQENSHKNLFSDQVKKHEELINIIKQNCTAQDNILQSLTDANAEIADIRMRIGNIFDTRNRLIQEYINSFKSFEDTLAKANEGVEFYKKQSAKLTKLIERLNALKAQYQAPAPPPVQIPPRSSLHRHIPPAMPSRQSPLPTWGNPDFQEPDLPPAMPDRPRLKDYLAAMKPDTWGSSTTGRPSKRSSLRREEMIYTPPHPPPSLPNLPESNPFYANATAAPGSLYSTVPSTAGPTLTSAPNFSPRHYPESSSTYLPPSNTQSMDRGATLLAQNFAGQSQMMYNTHPPQPIYQPNPVVQQTFHQPPSAQHTVRQPSPAPTPTPQLGYQTPPPQQPMYQSSYQPPPAQQPSYQSPLPQQPVYQPPPPQQQPMYQPPPAPQQPIYQPPPPPQQLVYQPPPPSQQPVYQPPPPAPLQQPVYQSQVPQQPMYQQPMYQVPPMQQPTHSSFVQQPLLPPQVNQQQMVQTPQFHPAQPTAYQNQLPHDPNRSMQQPLPQSKFDPYRPQPLGAYDIPKSLHQPTATNPQPHVVPQNIPTQPRIHPQDVYRPGGLLTTTQTPMPSLSSNNNNYNPNQFVQYTPSPPAPAPTPTPQQRPPVPPLAPQSSPVQAPVNPVSPPPATANIVDDLLSLALEQQVNSPTIETQSAPSEPQSPPPLDEDPQPRSTTTKPIACIQPLSVLNEEKTPVPPPVVSPVANLSSLQDPYDDKEKLEQLGADVQRFEKHVSTMTKKILNGTVPLEVEWKELSDLQEKDVHTQTCAIGKCNPKLNRFQDLIPYDNSRVRLVQATVNQQKHFNDYINATSIDRIRDTALLTAQYPLATTVADYWSMIYDQHVAIVVVLLRADELQTVNVYPQKVGEEMNVSAFTITLLSTKSPSALTNHRILRVQHSQTNQSRTVVWLEHLGWPPKDMPDSPYELLKFIDEVQHYLRQTRNRRNTILATCLNGVSRTGPFWTLFTCIQDINEGRAFPDLNKIIRQLRSKRRHMIQDMNQLKFIYEAFLFYLQDFLVKRGVLKAGSIAHHQTSSSNIKAVSPIILLENEMQTIMDKAKPVVSPAVPNYDVGPILSSNVSEEKPTVKQLTAIEENFNLRPEESHIKPKTKRDDFFRTKSTQEKDSADPFSQLDPLWTFR